MKLQLKKKYTSLHPSDTVVLFFPQEIIIGKRPIFPDPLKRIEGFIKTGFLKGLSSETHFFPIADNPGVIISCLGPEKDITGETLRNAAGSVIDAARARSIKTIHVILPSLKTLDPPTALTCVSEGLFLANYSFTRYKSKSKASTDPLVEAAVLIGDVRGGDGILREVTITSSNALLCRDLINETSDNCTSVHFARAAKKLVSIPGVSCRILGKREIEKLGMGLFLAVNRGSANPPQLVILTYRGNGRSRKNLALVGKGITFDSGGINLKPTGNIESMRSDMSGAASVMYAVKTAAELRLPVNLFGVIPLTDNMLSNNSYRPGDIFIAYNKKTVEIGNTDAEGRLVLADAIAFTEKVLKPDCIVDMATLTGACIIALGECVAAYLTDPDDLVRMIESASKVTGEKVWRLPLVREYEDNMKSDFADISNMSAEKNAGTIMGAIFIKNFVEKTPWMHIDIAGTSWYSKKRGYMPKYATGYGVRLLAAFVKEWFSLK